MTTRYSTRSIVAAALLTTACSDGALDAATQNIAFVLPASTSIASTPEDKDPPILSGDGLNDDEASAIADEETPVAASVVLPDEANASPTPGTEANSDDVSEATSISMTVEPAPNAIVLDWEGGGDDGFGVDRRFDSDECLGNVCTDHLAWVTGSSSFVDQDVRAGVAYRYKVTSARGVTTGFSEPVVSVAVPVDDEPAPAATEPSGPVMSGRPGPTGVGGSAGNLNNSFVRNEPEHPWLDGNWNLEFGDDFEGDRLDETVWYYFEDETHRLSTVCPNNNEGYCSGDNFVPHSSRLDRNHATVANNALMMDVTASPSESKVQMSFLQTWQDRGQGWERRLQPNSPAAPNGFKNTFFGVEEGPLYIEASVNFSQAYPAVGAWWAFWLYSPDTWLTPVDRWCEGHHLPSSCPADLHPQLFERPADLDSGFCGRPANFGEGCTFFARATGGIYQNYDNNFDATDNNANTGMEVDIFEFAPDVTSDGFNIALYKSHRFDREGTEPNSPQTGLRPNGDHFTAFNTDDFMLANAGPAYADTNATIDISEDRYHRLGMYWDANRYSFYLDGYHMWTITDQAWITRQRRNGIRLTWEHSHGLWTTPNPGSLPDNDGDGIPQARTFLNAGDHPKVYIDYVKVLRKQ